MSSEQERMSATEHSLILSAWVKGYTSQSCPVNYSMEF